MIKKTERGWLVDIQPGGRGAKRFRKTLTTKLEAIRWQSWVEKNVVENPEWEPRKKDARRLSDLLQLWFDIHGRSLSSGEGTRIRLEKAVEKMGNPIAATFNASRFITYRAKRLESGVSENTMNRELSYLRSMFNELIRSELWLGSNPLSKVRPFKIHEAELAFLTTEQISLVLETTKNGVNPSTYNVVRLCLATGARWGEAESIRSENIIISGEAAHITFVKAKSKKNRSVPLDVKLAKEVKHKKYGRLFGSCYSAFRDAIKRTGIELPEGQLTHILRHTFGSHFMMNGGNILVLQKVLGHSSLNVTMRYAHFAPDHLKQALELNPLVLTQC